MARFPLEWILDRAHRAPEELDEAWDRTRFPARTWDLRTLIAVFPDGHPLRCLNINTVVGLTGTPLDLVPWSRRGARDSFDLQAMLCASDGRIAHHKAVHSLEAYGDMLSTDPVGVGLKERIAITGTWPRYHVWYRDPAANLILDGHMTAVPPVHWFVRVPRIYSHNSIPVRLDLQWTWGKDKGRVEVPALFEHGWGARLRLPITLFRYEVLVLPSGSPAMSLRVDGPGGFTTRTQGVQIAPREVGDYRFEVLETQPFPNHHGERVEVPHRWRGHHDELTYEATRVTVPQPALGGGLIYGFEYVMDGVAGRGYAEHMARNSSVARVS